MCAGGAAPARAHCRTKWAQGRDRHLAEPKLQTGERVLDLANATLSVKLVTANRPACFLFFLGVNDDFALSM